MWQCQSLVGVSCVCWVVCVVVQVSYEELARVIPTTRKVYVPDAVFGGGERAVLEVRITARADATSLLPGRLGCDGPLSPGNVW